MAMHFDHMYIECLDTKSSISKELEAKHLKELVLLHLDLIQQQSEDLSSKDKVIKGLQDENELLRCRLDRIERRISLCCHKQNDALPPLSIKQEQKEAISVTNNNVLPCTSPSSTILIPSPTHDGAEAPLLSSQEPQSSPNNPLVTRLSDVSPPSSRVLRNCSSSPVSVKNTIKDEVLNSIPSVFELVSPLRHSPRLDVNSTSNSSYLEGNNKRDTDSPSSNCSRGSIDIKYDARCSPNRNTLSDCHTLQQALNSNLKLLASDKKVSRKFPTKKCSQKDKSRVDTSHSEYETSDTEHKSEAIQPDTRSRSSDVATSNKRKSEANDGEPEFKRRHSMPWNVDSSKSFNPNKSLDYESDGTTNHSLRSREKTLDVGSCSPSIESPYKTDDGTDRSKSCRHVHSMSESSADESANTEDNHVSAEEYERVFVKSATDAAARLREHNVKVPGCGVRTVRSCEGVLCTDLPYFLPTEPPADLTEPSDALGVQDYTTTPVEIPRWRVSILSSLYIMEGTENLEDEVFTKRHNKLEQDEKRRKRWDLQRLREQRQYEKLKERYEVRNSSSTSATTPLEGGDIPPCSNILCSHHSALCSTPPSATSAGAGGVGAQGSGTGAAGGGAGAELVSLWPDPEMAMYLEVVDKVPVCAFGQPCAVTPSSEFSLPWLRGADSPTARRRKR